MADNNQEEHHAYANAGDLYQESRHVQANRIPARGRLPGNYGPSRSFHGVGLRMQPYNQGWCDSYSPHDGLTLADAVRGTWTAAGNMDGFGGRQLPTPLQAQNY